MKETFPIQGSKGNSYKIEFSEEDGLIKVKCSCPAGRFGKFCKHKMRFILGDGYILEDDSQIDALAKIADRIQNSNYFDLIVEHSKAKRAVEEAEANLKKVRGKIAEAMKKGA